MTMTGLRTHGIREFQHNETEAELCAEAVRNIGYAVIPSGLTEDQLQLIRDKIDQVYKIQIQEIGGADNLELINDANVARALVSYDDYFVTLAAHLGLISVLKILLGQNFILMSQNGIINQPSNEHYQLTWHRDLNYQHFVTSRPLAISALYCIDEFTAETGGTLVIPASHKIEAFPSTEYILRQQHQISAPAGSIIIFDAMLFHRTGNNTSGRTRRAVNHIFTLPLIKQQISLPKTLGDKYANDPFLRSLLGYDSQTGESTQLWREGKLRKARQSA